MALRVSLMDGGGVVEALSLLRDSMTSVFVVTGPVAGMDGPGLARTTALGVSPLSGAVAETRAEGPFAAGMRRAGITGVGLHGAAPSPVCVVVTDGVVSVEPAEDLWGLDTFRAFDRLADRYGADSVTAVIGPAGERGVRYASVVTCRDHPLPRLGFGALLGAKHVKAVVCRGSSAPQPASPASLARIAAWYAAAVPENSLTRLQHGTPGFAVWSGPPGYAAVANFADTSTPSAVDAPVLERVAACPGCPTDCMKVYAGTAVHQEALAMLGANLGVADPFPLHTSCVRLGVDPVSFGGAAAAAGIAPVDVAAALEGLAADDPYGVGAGAAGPAAMTSKGVELPPFDPRVQPNLGLAYAVSPIGPRYDAVEHDLDFDPVAGLPAAFDEVRALGVPVPRPLGTLDPAGTAILMRLWSGLDALGVCLYAATPTRPLTLSTVEDLVLAVTGSRPDVMALGAERFALQHDINRRLGVGPDRDTLPDRFFTEPVSAGPYRGAVLDRTAFTDAVVTLRQLLFGGFTP